MILYEYVYLEPFEDPCLEWNLGLVLEGSTTKIEDKQVAGNYQPFHYSYSKDCICLGKS